MKKIIKIILYIMLLLILLGTCVNAEDEACKITLSANKATLNPGDEVTITLNMSDITKSSGIYQFMSVLNFKDDIFEIVKVEDSELKQDLEDSEYGECDILYSGLVDTDPNIKNPWYLLYIEESGMHGIIGSSTADPQKENQIIGKIKLKVKDTVTTSTSTEISLESTEVFDAESISSGTVSGDVISNTDITLTINGSGNGGSNNPGNSNQQNLNPDPIITSNQQGYDTIKNNTEAKNKDGQQENKSKEDVPYTGIEDYIPAIFVLIVLGTMGYINYRKYKDIY